MEAVWFHNGTTYLLLGLAPRIGAGTPSKKLISLIYVCGMVPAWIWIIATFMVVEISPGELARERLLHECFENREKEEIQHE